MLVSAKMKLSYEPEADHLWFRWNSKPVEESDEVEPEVIFELNADGNVVGIEVLNASKKLDVFFPK